MENVCLITQECSSFNLLFTVETNENETETKPPEEKKEPAAVA